MQSTSLQCFPVSKSLTNESININEKASVDYWVTTFECSEFDLRMAVADVGTSAKDVGTELGRAV